MNAQTAQLFFEYKLKPPPEQDKAPVPALLIKRVYRFLAVAAFEAFVHGVCYQVECFHAQRAEQDCFGCTLPRF
jgi:hypothetical protein